MSTAIYLKEWPQAEAWLEAMSAERGAADNTLMAYREDARIYLEWMQAAGLTLAEMDRGLIVQYLDFLRLKNFALATVARRLSVVRSLHRFLLQDGHAKSDPTRVLGGVKAGRPLPFVLSEKEVSSLLDTAHSLAADRTFPILQQASFARRAAMFETLYASGMRISEAIRLPVSVLSRKSDTVVIEGKGKKERLILLNERAIEAMQLWRARSKAYGGASASWLFHQVRDGSTPLSRQSVDLEIKDAAIRAGISQGRKVSAHILRHAFATHLLTNGVDLRTLQVMLGHADLGSTEIYTHIDTSRLEKAMDFHPLAGEDQ